MNHAPSRRRRAQPHPSGMALVIVLGIIVLIAALVVGFIMRAGTERTSSFNYRANASTRELADTVVNLVQAQISTASNRGEGFIWASQPGAIRSFDQQGDLDQIFRLYSATSLTAATAAELDADMPIAQWASAPAQWVDLNAPVTTEAGGVKIRWFPVLDPRDPTNETAINPIEGFGIENAPGAKNDQSLPDYQPAPMPVRWLYVLQDGQIIASDVTSDGTVASFAGSATKPSKENPIVGRVAFWTDDDSNRINVNTAAGGIFWDVPRFNYADERDTTGAGLAKFQPAAGEYQRYPGHPALTTLSKVFPTLSVPQRFSLLPRYTHGGSTEATVLSTSPIAPNKSERLFTSTGEMLLDANRNLGGLSRTQLESSRFFVTAHSRSPELNLFGKPRISMWPIHALDDNSHRTTIDRLIAFCATINEYPYYFTRDNNMSRSADIGRSRNDQLLNYLDRLSSEPVPGFGGNFKTKYGNDQRQILVEMFDYIRSTNLRDATVGIPYADTSRVPTDTSGAGQVTPSVHSSWGVQGFGRFPRISEVSMLLVGMGEGARTGPPAEAANPVMPDQMPTYVSSSTGNLTPPPDTKAVQGFLLMNFFDPAQGYSRLNPSLTLRITGLNAFTLDGKNMEMPASATLFVGTPPYGGTPAGYVSGSPFGGIIDFRSMICFRRLGVTDRVAQFPFYSKILEIPNSVLNPVLGPASFRIEVFAGNSVDLADFIQYYDISFPSQAMPAPSVPPATDTTTPRRFGSSGYFANQGGMDRTGYAYLSTWPLLVNSTYDSILSMVPSATWGDYRLMAQASVPASAFVLHPSAGASRMAFGMRIGSGTPFAGSTHGKLVTGTAESVTGAVPPRPPAVPATVAGVGAGGNPGIPGDWDNGVADSADGPYINKPDEGNIHTRTTGSQIPYFDSGQHGYDNIGSTYFSPNRQMPSPVMFGSLSTGVLAQRPWQTLLFRPGPSGHAGLASPPDHLWLDLFWMPVAEPYAISEPLSTAGKVNLNYQIVPFSYITRSTALRSVLASERVAAVPKGAAAVYKTTPQPGQARWPLNLSDTNGTLRQFKEKFASGEIFKSASEICDIFLVPSNRSWTSNSGALSDWYGDDFALVGDNVRERPYAGIYPRVTTKSNVFTVYYTVQALKNRSPDPSIWKEDSGVVIGEYRGSTTLERFIDPNNTNIPDYATETNAPALDTFYKWRIISNNQFAP